MTKALAEGKPSNLGIENKNLIYIEDIAGVHPEIQRILLESGVDVHFRDYIPSISSYEIRSFSERNPIGLHYYKGKIFVISNVELYYSALRRLAENPQVFVIIHKIKMCKAIRNIIRGEILIKPVFHARSYRPDFIFRINKWMNESIHYSGLSNVPTTKSGFAKWLHVDERRIK